jgi:hypothetical protein
MKRWNRWHVYNWLKHRYMATGFIPNLAEVITEFHDMDHDEIVEGLEEFLSVVNYQLPVVSRIKQNTGDDLTRIRKVSLAVERRNCGERGVEIYQRMLQNDQIYLEHLRHELTAYEEEAGRLTAPAR